jgi:hypothetical protein
MFDITPDDIRQLNDIDLRELVGRLCEAELLSRGRSPAAVTWGGNQTAEDGGLESLRIQSRRERVKFHAASFASEHHWSMALSSWSNARRRRASSRATSGITSAKPGRNRRAWVRVKNSATRNP